MTIQLTRVQEEQLEQFAEQSGRAADELAQEAIDNFLTHRRDFVAAVHEGLASAERGELIEHEDAMALMDAIIDGRERHDALLSRVVTVKKS